MEVRETCYAIEQFQSQWVVSVRGTRVLTCRTKRAAVNAARRAVTLLRQNEALPSEALESAPSEFPARKIETQPRA